MTAKEHPCRFRVDLEREHRFLSFNKNLEEYLSKLLSVYGTREALATLATSRPAQDLSVLSRSECLYSALGHVDASSETLLAPFVMIVAATRETFPLPRPVYRRTVLQSSILDLALYPCHHCRRLKLEPWVRRANIRDTSEPNQPARASIPPSCGPIHSNFVSVSGASKFQAALSWNFACEAGETLPVQDRETVGMHDLMPNSEGKHIRNIQSEKTFCHRGGHMLDMETTCICRRRLTISDQATPPGLRGSCHVSGTIQ